MNAVQNETERMVLRLISRRPEDWTYESALAAVKGFAALVAAHERDRMTADFIHTCSPNCDKPACVAVRKEIAAGVAAEREACAKLCEENMFYATGIQHAKAIRARGET